MTTKAAVKINFRHYGEITVPAGVKLTHQTATGKDEKYHFVDQFEWINTSYPEIANTLFGDAVFYGINIPAEFVQY